MIQNLSGEGLPLIVDLAHEGPGVPDAIERITNAGAPIVLKTDR